MRDVKLHNGGMLGLGKSRNVSSISNSALKGPAKELKLSFMLGEKYVKKIFLLFSGSESAEVSPNY